MCLRFSEISLLQIRDFWDLTFRGSGVEVVWGWGAWELVEPGHLRLNPAKAISYHGWGVSGMCCSFLWGLWILLPCCLLFHIPWLHILAKSRWLLLLFPGLWPLRGYIKSTQQNQRNDTWDMGSTFRVNLWKVRVGFACLAWPECSNQRVEGFGLIFRIVFLLVSDLSVSLVRLTLPMNPGKP